jgi:hypothetical protein
MPNATHAQSLIAAATERCEHFVQGYSRIYVGFRKLPNGTAIMCEDPPKFDRSERVGGVETR